MIIEMASHPPTKGISAIIGIAFLLFGAAMVFFQLKSALNHIWEVREHGRGGVKGLLFNYLVSFPMVLTFGALLFLLIIKSQALPILQQHLPSVFGDPRTITRILDGSMTIGLFTILFAFIYHILPEVNIAWSDTFIGAFVTALLFWVGQYLMSIYFRTFNIASAYGALGSITIMFIWVYYSSIIFLFGAIFTKVIARRSGSLPKPKKTPL